MKRILLVHDRQEDPEDRRRFFEARGYAVDLCRSGEECLAALDVDPPDVILMDILIDGDNGFEVCRRIRERKNAAELPVILCTGVYRSHVFRQEAKDAGAQALHVRPFDGDALIGDIEQYAGERALAGRR